MLEGLPREIGELPLLHSISLENNALRYANPETRGI
jgi:hypothetical protein